MGRFIRKARLLEIAAEGHGLEVDLADVALITPEELAESLTDAPSRVALLSTWCFSTLDAEVSEPEVELLEQYCAARGGGPRGPQSASAPAGHLRRMAFDLGRRSFAPSLLGKIWSRDGLAELWKFAKVALGIEGSAAAARFEELGRLPENTLGYGVYPRIRRQRDPTAVNGMEPRTMRCSTTWVTSWLTPLPRESCRWLVSRRGTSMKTPS